MGYLSGPVNTLTDMQVEWNGLLMGPGTPYGVPPVWQFLDLAPIKTMDLARVWADGSWSGPDFADVYTPQMDVEIWAPSEAAFVSAVQAFVKAFGPSRSPRGLWVQLPGMPLMGVLAKTNKRVVPIDLSWGQLSIASVQWRVTDPAWQSMPRTVLLQSSGSVKSGLVFPMFSFASGTYAAPGTADFGLTTAGASSAQLVNAGNVNAWPVVVVTGSAGASIAGGFTITLDGHSVTYALDVPAGQSVTLDYAAGTATLTGGVDRTAALSSRDFTAVTSTSNVVFTANSGTASVTIADRQE